MKNLFKSKINIITRLRDSNNSEKNYKYTLFNNESSNILYYSENPLLDISEDIKKLNYFKFDKVYSSNYPINLIYQEIIKDKINDLFFNKNTCIFFFGPSFGGKSYLCRGSPIINENESGLITRTINDIFKIINMDSNFNVKISVYQIYLDKIYDLLLNNNNNINDIFELNKKEIKNNKEFDLILREAINNRNNLIKNLSTNNNDIKKVSHLIISLYIKNIKEMNISEYSQIDFVELSPCDYGLLNENEINDNLENKIYRNINNTFNLIAENIINISKNITSNINNNNILISSLKNTMKINSNIILINCVIPWEFPLKNSYNSSKFINMIYNKVNEFQEINKEDNFTYYLDSNKINNNIQNNNIRHERMVDYLNNLTIDKKYIPKMQNNTTRRNHNKLNYNYNTNDINNIDNKVEKYLLKLPIKTKNNKKKKNNIKEDIINKKINISFDIKYPKEKELKLNEINKELKKLENQNKKLNQISKEEEEIDNKKENIDNIIINNNKIIDNNNITYAELKSDNIIMKQDIERLQQVNKNLEYYLSEERNRNIKIINQNEELENKIIKLEKILEEAKIREEKNKMNEINIEKILNDKMEIDKKYDENIKDMNKLKEEKEYYEIEYKVLYKEYNELKNNYDKLYDEFNKIKSTNNEQLNNVEEKVDNLLSEIDKLRNENNILRKDNENQRINLNEINNENIIYKERMNEFKKENEILNMKYNELMKEYDEYKKEKINEDMIKYKFEENKRIKNENKMKIVNELQSKIQNYRKQRFNKDIDNN